ncbi:MAG: DUF1223 domain-containing protein [Planctomycetota bacterium]
MKTYLVALTVLSLGTLWLSTANAKPIPTHRGPFAVVELFTSEGCSSCPPAERLLNQINQDHGAEGERVFVLAFHVDYWNRLGWTDPFSDPAYAQRQREYAAAFNNRSIYTPQMVVNGQAEFVGSRAAEAHRQIRQTRQADRPADVGVGLKVRRDADTQTLHIDWQIDHVIDGTALQFAVVEDGLVTDVTRGENRGKTLEHDGVVRVFYTLQPEGTRGFFTLNHPDDLQPKRAAVVAFLQDLNTMKIIGAHRVALIAQ